MMGKSGRRPHRPKPQIRHHPFRHSQAHLIDACRGLSGTGRTEGPPTIPHGQSYTIFNAFRKDQHTDQTDTQHRWQGAHGSDHRRGMQSESLALYTLS